MKLKILILGASGMAGHVVYYYLNSLNKYDLYTVCHHEKLNEDSFIVDIKNIGEIQSVIIDVQPNIIINCIGLLIKACQYSTKDAVFVNAYFPHLLAEMIDQSQFECRLIHISTDCVFSGKKGLYSDNDEKDALDIYGMTKNLGEIKNGRDLTIRTSIIGPELKKNGGGLFHWIFLNKHQKRINGYTKSIWSGVTTLELAKVIDFCIENNIIGLYQVSNNEPISKSELIKIVVGIFGLNLEIVPIDGIISDKSILITKLKEVVYCVPSYHQMIEELYKFMIHNKFMYTQYLEVE